MDEITIGVRCDSAKDLHDKFDFVMHDILMKLEGVHSVGYLNQAALLEGQSQGVVCSIAEAATESPHMPFEQLFRKHIKQLDDKGVEAMQQALMTCFVFDACQDEDKAIALIRKLVKATGSVGSCMMFEENVYAICDLLNGEESPENLLTKTDEAFMNVVVQKAKESVSKCIE